jgi:hypothetical protein
LPAKELFGGDEVQQLRHGRTITIVEQDRLEETARRRRHKQRYHIGTTELTNAPDVGAQKCGRFDHRLGSTPARGESSKGLRES